MSFDKNKVKLLEEKLAAENVKQRDGTGNTKLSYLASHHVIDEANRIFGFGAWGTEILSLSQVDRTEYEKPAYNAGDAPKPMISISYLCKLRVTVKSDNSETIYEDTGFGNGVAGFTAYGIGSCIELASKEAVTDALKRCMRYFGNQFGNSLYNKDAERLPEMGEIEAAKIVTNEQLEELRELYPLRGIDDEWVLAALKAENYPCDTLEMMRNDWFVLAIRITTKYKFDEIAAESYKEDIKGVIDMLEKSATFNMAKALFKEVWEKAKKQDDKETMASAQKIYESLKEKFEVKK